MAFIPWPRTSADNAYDLLSDIIHVISDEPLRIDMSIILDTRGVLSNRQQPACGAVGCIAGWTLALTGNATRGGNVYGTAVAGAILGITRAQAHELFYPWNIMEANNKQTLAHAEAVVAHILAFQAKYKQQLQAQKI